MIHDPYRLLEVSPGASAADIKRAFRRLAMAWHPDRNPSREAEERFKQIKAAYELLLDPEALAAWFAEHAAASAEPDAPHLSLSLTLEEAAAGCRKTLELATDRTCDDCDGSGRIEHRTSVACASCKGVGRTGRGRHSAPCSPCGGRGYVRTTPCPSCQGRGTIRSLRQVDVRIPAGMQAGERLRLARQHRPRSGEAASDLFVTLELLPHPLFVLEGRDLYLRMPVNIFRLMHGGALDVPTLNGMQQISLQPYPGHALEYRLPGLGFPGRHGRGAGQLRLTLVPVFPESLSEADQKLLLRLEKTMLGNPSTHAPELERWEQTLARLKSGQPA